MDNPEQCAAPLSTQHIPAPSDQHSTTLPSGQGLEEMQNTEVSFQKGAKLTGGLSQQDGSTEEKC